MDQAHGFAFIDPGKLLDGDLELVLVENFPGNPALGLVPSYKFEMRTASGNNAAGSISLRIGDTEHIKKYAGHIGYNVAPDYRGHRYAARSCALLLPLARAHAVNPLWITCNPDNVASRKTCEIIGGEYVETVKLPKDTVMYKRGERLKCRYRVDL